LFRVERKVRRREKPETPKLPGRDPIWARLLIVFGALLVLAAGGSITATKVLAHRYDRAVHKDTLLAPGSRTTDEPSSSITGPLNYLLIGSDARADNPEDGQRSDTMIIVHVPASLDRAYLISIPRDLLVDIPAYPPTNFGGSHEKINGAFQYGGGGAGGVQLVSATLTQLTGIRFDGAAVIDFDGFRKAVELLGGVTMCVDERTESIHIGWDSQGHYLAPYNGPEGEYRNPDSHPMVYDVGCQHLAAWQALDYVRQRKTIPDGDFGRQRHQQQFLRAIFNEARRQGVATDPIKLDRLIEAVGSSLTVDTNGIALPDLVFGLRGIKPDALIGLKLPSYPQDMGGISYVLPYEDQAQTLYTALREDSLDEWATSNPAYVNTL
jgi:LCP family protein required for cell wall assembly